MTALFPLNTNYNENSRSSEKYKVSPCLLIFELLIKSLLSQQTWLDAMQFENFESELHFSVRTVKTCSLHPRITINKTSVGSVKLGKTLDLGTRLSPGYSGNLLATAR